MTAQPPKLLDIFTADQLDQIAAMCETVARFGYGEVAITFNRGHPQRVTISQFHRPAWFPFSSGPLPPENTE